MQLLLAVITGWFITFVSVALGGWLVFKTKRESHEGLFNPGKQEAEVFNVDDFGDLDGEKVAKEMTEQPQQFESDIMRNAQNRFQQQFNEGAAVNSVVDAAVSGSQQQKKEG